MTELTQTPADAGAGASGRTVAAGRGLEWWSEAWALFTKAAVMWIALAIVLIIIGLVLAFIPIIGGIAMTLMTPAFMAGWVVATRKVEAGGTLELGDLFTAFQGDKLKPLLVLGALLLAFTLAIVVVAGLLGIGAIIGVAAGGAGRSVGAALAAVGAGLLALLVSFAIAVVGSMALWFAPALVVFRGTAPLDAMRISFGASLRNVVPFLIYGVLAIVAAIIASIPLGLGWLVLLPLGMITLYVSYTDVFGA